MQLPHMQDLNLGICPLNTTVAKYFIILLIISFSVIYYILSSWYGLVFNIALKN